MNPLPYNGSVRKGMMVEILNPDGKRIIVQVLATGWKNGRRLFMYDDGWEYKDNILGADKKPLPLGKSHVQ